MKTERAIEFEKAIAELALARYKFLIAFEEFTDNFNENLKARINMLGISSDKYFMLGRSGLKQQTLLKNLKSNSKRKISNVQNGLQITACSIDEPLPQTFKKTSKPNKSKS